MKDIIYIREAMRVLNHDHYRTFRNWCKKVGIVILKDHGVRRKYIIRSHFMHARLNGVILSMKERYNENWLEMLALNIEGDLLEIIRIEEQIKERKNPEGEIDSLSGNHEKRYKSRLNKFISEL